MKSFILNILKENLKLIGIFIIMILLALSFLVLLFTKGSDLVLGWFTVPLFALSSLVVIPITYIIISYRIILASGIFAAYETSKDKLSFKIGEHVNNRVNTLGLSNADFVKDGLNIKETFVLIIDELIEFLPDGIEKHVKKAFSKMPIDQLMNNVATDTGIGVANNLNLGDKVFNAIDNKIHYFLKPSFKWNYLLFLINLGIGLLVVLF